MIDMPIFIACIVLSSLAGYLLAARLAAARIATLTSERENLQARLSEAVESTRETTLDRYQNSDEFKALLALEFEKGKNEGALNALVDYKASDDFSALVDFHHQQGKMAGAAEELDKFHITYTPIIDDHETWYSHRVDVGYDMQIHYAGFPIGSPARHITHHQQKSKDENINRLVGVVAQTLEIAAGAASKHKIPVTVAKAPKRAKRS